MNVSLWKAIEQFDISQNNVPYGFALRLASEQNWTQLFTETAILEYKKFMYLAATLDQMVSPSPIIDHVWHQHLIFTESYEEFSKVIGKKIRHNPGVGMNDEDHIFKEAFQKTLEQYRLIFGKENKTIWHYTTPYDQISWKTSLLKGLKIHPMIALLIGLSLIPAVYFTVGRLYPQIPSVWFLPGFLIAALCSTFLWTKLSKRKIYRTVQKFPENSLLNQLNFSELIYAKHDNQDYVIQCLVNESVRKGIIAIAPNTQKFQLIAPQLATTSEDYLIIRLFEQKQLLSYNSIHQHLKSSASNQQRIRVVDTLQTQFEHSVNYIQTMIGFTLLNAFLFALGIVRIITGLQREKPTILLYILIILYSCLWMYFQQFYPKRLFKDALCQIYEKYPTHDNWGCESRQFNYYYSRDKRAFIPSLLVLSTLYLSLVNVGHDYSGNYRNRGNSSCTSSGCGSSCGSSCGGGCGGCGGCGS